MKNHREMSQKWESLRLEIIQRINEIDKATEADDCFGTPPNWWLHMMDVLRTAAL